MDLVELAMLLETMDVTEATEEQFKEAADVVSKSTFLPDEQKLQFYGLYKQSTIGNVNTSRPWAIDMVGRAKWDAWKNFEGFPQKSAALAYVYLSSQLKGIEPSSEKHKSASNMSGMGVTVSTLSYGDDTDAVPWSASEALFQAVTEGDVEATKSAINNGCDINMINSEGMRPIHYACDRGNLDILNALLETNQVDVNCQDSEGQTPLMYAITCEQLEIIEILMDTYRVDIEIKNNNQESVLDLAVSSSDEVHQFVNRMILKNYS